MRIAVVDVGTNTTRLYVAEVTEAGVGAELTRVSQVTRLGAGVDCTGLLAPDALAREYAVLQAYAETIRSSRVDRAVAVMTSAVRDAANGGEFAEQVAARFGLDVHILSGELEAQLTYQGAAGDGWNPPASGDQAETTLVFDIGGGSTEIVLGHGPTPDFHVSTQAGVVRQADRHIRSDPPTEPELRAVAEDVRAVLSEAVPAARRTQPERAIGVAGTPTSLAAIAQQLEPYDPARVHGYRLRAAERDAIFARLASMPLTERQRVPGLHPDRALAILPGVVILAEVMALFGLAEIEVSEHDILRGAALHYASC